MGCGSSASVEVTEKSKSQTIPTARTTASNTANVQSNPMSKQQPLTIKTLDNTAEPRSIDIKIPIAEKEAVNAVKKSNSKPDDDDDEDDDEDDNDEDDDDEESDEDEDEKANENNKRIGTKSESFEAQLSVDRSKIDASKDPKTRNAELARAMREEEKKKNARKSDTEREQDEARKSHESNRSAHLAKLSSPYSRTSDASGAHLLASSRNRGGSRTSNVSRPSDNSRPSSLSSAPTSPIQEKSPS